MGLGTVVIRSHSQPGVDLTYVKQSGESNGDAGDQYTGLDRFGRVVDQRWIKTSSGTATDRFQYGYDRDSNRLWRDNLVNSAFGELYSYDNLNQITSFDRGTLNANKNGISGSPTRQQAWDFDALGNFDSVTTDSSTQTRSHNDQNEITSISGATTPTYDANGNMTGDETGRKFVYDAFNRLVTMKDSSNNVLESFAYDGVNRRVSTTASSTTTGLYYSAEWQVLEERVGGNTTMQYVWSPVYIDALILRDRDTDANGSLDERLWVQQDANFNVTALVNGSGSVIERYGYDPFGSATVFDASWGSRSSSSYVWVYLHQGGRFDATSGLYYFRNRDYSPTLGRWMRSDPLEYTASGPNLNRYEGNRPGEAVDAFGLIVFPAFSNPFLVWEGWDKFEFAGLVAGFHARSEFFVTAVTTENCKKVRYTEWGKGEGKYFLARGGIGVGYFKATLHVKKYRAGASGIKLPGNVSPRWPVEEHSKINMALIGVGGSVGDIPVNADFACGPLGRLYASGWWDASGLNVFIGGFGISTEAVEVHKEIAVITSSK